MTIVLVALGLLVPFVVSLIKKEQWSTKVKFLLCLAVSFAVTAITMFIQGEFHTWLEFVAKSGIVFATSQSFYVLHFGDTDINATLTAIGSDIVEEVKTYTPDEVDVLIDNAVVVAVDAAKQKVLDEIAAAAKQVTNAPAKVVKKKA